MNTNGQSAFRWPWPFDTAALITLLSVALTVIKLMTVAGGDPETAYAILQTQGTGTVIVGALLTSIGLVIVPIGVVLIVRYFRTASDSRPIALIVSSIALITIVTLVTPWFELVSIIATSLVLLLLATIVISSSTSSGSMWEKWKTQVERLRKDWLRTSIALYGASVLLVGIANQTPWLPAEKISLRGNPPITGYVLARDQSEITVLNYQTTSIENFPNQEITDIQECRTAHYWREETLIEALYVPTSTYTLPHYSPCPNA